MTTHNKDAHTDGERGISGLIVRGPIGEDGMQEIRIFGLTQPWEHELQPLDTSTPNERRYCLQAAAAFELLGDA